MAYYLKLLLNMALPLVQRLHLPSHRRLLCAATIELTSAVDPNAIISFGREISSRARPGFKAVRGESTDVLTTYSDTTFCVIYLDYMTNNVSTTELEDIERAASMVGKQPPL